MLPELLADHECLTGEGPLYHPEEGRVYWVDIPNGDLFRYDLQTGEHERCYDTEVIGGFTFQSDGDLLLFEDDGKIETWSDGETHTLIEGIPAEHGSRFNDVVADPRGRVFAGSMPTESELGTLYRIETDGSYTRAVETGFDVPNGMGFSLDDEYLYVTESGESAVYRYDYDPVTGAIGDRSMFIDRTEEPGFPDGLTVDSEGSVWSANWNGGTVVRYTPEGEPVAEIEFPARKVSSVTFGGENYEQLFVTTALGSPGNEGTKATEGDGAGALFRVSPEATGQPEYRSSVGL